MRYLCLIVFLASGCKTFHSCHPDGETQRDNNKDAFKNCEFIYDHDLQEYCADCSNREMTEVPDNLLTNITCLNLFGNKIVDVSGQVWQKYKYLRKLSLANNCLRTLNDYDFQNLSGLDMLDLSLNYIRYYDISENAFAPLNSSLTYLDLKQSFTLILENETYPPSLKHLQELHILMIDGKDDQIPNMTRLSSLYLSGHYGRCHIPHLNKSMFANVHLKSLYLSNCSILTIEEGFSSNLPEIEEIDLSWNTKLGFRNVTLGLQGTNVLKHLKKLNLNSVYEYYKFDSCTTFTTEDIKYLNTTKLEVLAIESNNLVRIEEGVVNYWPIQSLKYLSVRDNMLMYGKYVDEIFHKHIFQSLVYYDSSEMFLSHTPNDFVHNTTGKELFDFNPVCSKQKGNDKISAMFTRFRCKDYFQILKERLARFNITRNSGNYDATLNTISSKTEYVDVSENLPGTVIVTLKLFENSPSLKVLNISNNFLGYQLFDDINFFKNYSSLKVLDLSNNGIIQLRPGVFKYQVNLEQLYLSDNKIIDIAFLNDSLHYKKLKYLDLSSNRILSIPGGIRALIDQHSNFTINIANNNLICTCHYIHFVSWIKKSNVTFENLESTKCKLKDGSEKSLNELNYDELHLECSASTYNVLILIVSLCILAFIIIVSCGLIYRFKWKLRYLYYMTKFKLTDGYQPIGGAEFQKEVFVSYADEDSGFVRQHVVPELEDKGNISLLVHDRDFLAGEFVADNILKAVTTCRKTLVILTTAFIRSKWCMYELNMARIEAIETGRNVLGVVLKEDIPVNTLPIEITEVIKNQTYIEFPTDHQHMTEFWERLRATLRH